MGWDGTKNRQETELSTDSILAWLVGNLPSARLLCSLASPGSVEPFPRISIDESDVAFENGLSSIVADSARWVIRHGPEDLAAGQSWSSSYNPNITGRERAKSRISKTVTPNASEICTETVRDAKYQAASLFAASTGSPHAPHAFLSLVQPFASECPLSFLVRDGRSLSQSGEVGLEVGERSQIHASCCYLSCQTNLNQVKLSFLPQPGAKNVWGKWNSALRFYCPLFLHLSPVSPLGCQC